MTLLMLKQAARIRPDAGFEKSVPIEHPYMQLLRQYQTEFGSAKFVLLALLQKNGDIYN